MGRRREEILRYHCAAVMKENVLAENLPNVFPLIYITASNVNQLGKLPAINKCTAVTRAADQHRAARCKHSQRLTQQTWISGVTGFGFCLFHLYQSSRTPISALFSAR